MKSELTLSVVHLAASDEQLEKINALGLLKELKAEDVFIRGMKLVGDKLTSHLGKFRSTDLPHVASLTKGAPVMVGHNRMMRPIGRFFDAYVEQGFVVAPFYVPTARSDAGDLVTDIDAGVAAEASISFIYTQPTCSKCGKDMREMECGHYPGRDGAFYYFDGIRQVLEGSIVYRGAHPDTGFVKLGEESIELPLALLSDSDWKGLMEKASPTVELGRSLAATLNRLIDARVTESRSRDSIKNAMAAAAGIERSTVLQILSGAINCPPLSRLSGFARVLGVSVSSLVTAASRDGCTYRERQTVGGGVRLIHGN